MQETQMERGDEKEGQSAEKKDDFGQMVGISRGTSHESLWGAVLFACMLIFVVASIAGVGWVAYTKWRSERIAKSQPSIAILSEQASNEEKTVSSVDEVQAADAAPAQGLSVNDSVTAAKKLEISVLNGGGIKGSAGTLASFLKTEGYSKTIIGNTMNNYTGVTIYYVAQLEKETAAIKESVIKKYPQAKVLPTDVKNKETAVSQVTIILGK